MVKITQETGTGQQPSLFVADSPILQKAFAVHKVGHFQEGRIVGDADADMAVAAAVASKQRDDILHPYVLVHSRLEISGHLDVVLAEILVQHFVGLVQFQLV